MIDKIRLLWYYPSFELEGKYPGGYRTLALAKALVRNGVSHVTIASILLKESRRVSNNIDLFAIHQNPLIVWKSLYKLIRSRDINIVQERLGCGVFWNGWGVLAGNQAGLPVVGEYHEYPFGLKYKLVDYPRLRYVLKNCDRFFIINNIISQYIPLRKKERSKIIIVPNGFDASVLPKTDTHQAELINTWVTEKRKVIGYFGALTKDKGVDIILNLVRYVDDQYLFLIAGRGPLEEDVKRLCRELPDKCKYLGLLSQEKVYHAMSLCDVTLGLYRKDLKPGQPQYGNPLKVYESLAVGTPVIISVSSLSMLSAEIAELCVASKLQIEKIAEALDLACKRKALLPIIDVLRKYSWDYIAKNISIPIYEEIARNTM